ncbi:hypothetical protein [Geodermatophilus ruber]|uniref:hypothetical protein n=1 Tax=Geodermatophilus ruber TaxID=504800 RepID=UPI000B8280B5|nr:hypothetical protein [Geodermatophilus ruber]
MTQPYPPQQAGPGGVDRDATQQIPASQYGPPEYGLPQYGAPAPEPKQRNLLPWLVATGVALLVAVGVLLFLLLRGDDEGSTTDTAAQSAAPSSAPSDEGLGDVDGDAVVPPEAADEGLGDVDGDAVVPPPADEGVELPGHVIVEDGSVIPGSLDRGAAFMDEVVLGDYRSALGHGGADFQAYYGDDADLLREEIATGAGAPPVNYSIDGVGFLAEADADVLALTVELPDGTYGQLAVFVGEENGRAVVVGFQ